MPSAAATASSRSLRGPGRKHGPPVSGWKQQLVPQIGVPGHAPLAVRFNRRLLHRVLGPDCREPDRTPCLGFAAQQLLRPLALYRRLLHELRAHNPRCLGPFDVQISHFSQSEVIRAILSEHSPCCGFPHLVPEFLDRREDRQAGCRLAVHQRLALGLDLGQRRGEPGSRHLLARVVPARCY